MKRVLRWQWKWFLFRNRFVHNASQEELRRVVADLLEMPPRQMNTRLLDSCLAALHPEIDDPEYKAPSQERVLASVRDHLQSTERTQMPVRDAVPQNLENDTRLRTYRPALVSVIVLLTVLLLGTAIAYALGYPIWDYAFHWGEEQLRIDIEVQAPENAPEQIPLLQHQGVGKGDAFDEKLKELQFDLVLPQLPDEYSLTNMDSSASSIFSNLIGFYSAGETELHIFIQKVADVNATVSSFIEKNGDYETLTISGTNYYIFTNIDFVEAIWISPPYTIQIGGNLARQDLLNLLKTIDGGAT